MDHRKRARQSPYDLYRRQVSRSDRDEELAPANQRIDDMSFKVLAARVAAALKRKPAKTATNPDKENRPKADDNEAPAKLETS